MRTTLAGVLSFSLFSFSIACQSTTTGNAGDAADADEQACDEAAAILESCCPGVPRGSIGCRVETMGGGCDHVTTTYDVLIPKRDAEECVLHASCETLRQKDGVCEALRSSARGSHSAGAGDPGTPIYGISVCPSFRYADDGYGSDDSSGTSSSMPSYGTASASDSGATLPPASSEDASNDPSRCAGTATSCSSLDVTSCSQQDGCGVAGEDCIGAPTPCRFQGTESQCEQQLGCSWIPK